MSGQGRRVRELRLRLRPVPTQEALSLRLGLRAGYISDMELGRVKMPAPEGLRALARELGTTTIDLLHAAGYLTDGEARMLSLGRDDPLRRALEQLAKADPETQKRAAALLATLLARRERERSGQTAGNQGNLIRFPDRAAENSRETEVGERLNGESGHLFG